MNEIEAFLNFLYEDALLDVDIFDAILETIEKNSTESLKAKEMAKAFKDWYYKKFE